jgi:hypothetical protein
LKSAASKLGIPRQTLESKIRSFGIDKHRFRTARTPRNWTYRSGFIFFRCSSSEANAEQDSLPLISSDSADSSAFAEKSA